MTHNALNITKFKRAVTDACKMDDVPLLTALLTELTGTSIEHRSALTKRHILDIGLNRSIKANTTKVLSYVLEEGADLDSHGVNLILLWADRSLPSRETLDILVAHGWNIDSCGDEPLLWKVLGHPELVDWCISHGASVQLSTPANHYLRPILERAAAGGNITLFERLRSHGAPVSERVLPEAVRSANIYSPKNGESPDATYELHLNMVRHLTDEIGVDVNIGACWPGSRCSTPLCCIACYPKGDATQLIWLLLERGGDPHLVGPSDDKLAVLSVLQAAVQSRNITFLNAVDTWQLRNDENSALGRGIADIGRVVQ
jgi:hypothetical protein